MATVDVLGPNVAGSFNVYINDERGLTAFSLTLEAAIMMRQSLNEILDGKVKDQPVLVNPMREDDIVHWGAPGINGTACGAGARWEDGAYLIVNGNPAKTTCINCRRTNAFRTVSA